MNSIPDDIIEILLETTVNKRNVIRGLPDPWYESFFIQTIKVIFSVLLALLLIPYKKDIENVNLSEIAVILITTITIYTLINFLWYGFFVRILNATRTAKIYNLEEFITALEDVEFLRFQEKLFKK